MLDDADPIYEVPLSQLTALRKDLEQSRHELAESNRIHRELMEELLAHCPQNYEASEGSEEAIAVSYLRDLESLRDGLWESLPRALRMYM
jgi:hypothetical protein